MKKNSLGQTLEESFNYAESWIRQAEQQYLVAESISDKINIRDRSEMAMLRTVGYINNTTLLLALSVENAFKAVKASRNEFEVNEYGLIKKSLGGGGTGHTLLTLAKEINFSLNELEITLLKRLTEISIWAGKYHVPIKHDSFKAANLIKPNSLRVPSDLHMTKDIIKRASEMSGVSPVLQ